MVRWRAWQRTAACVCVCLAAALLPRSCLSISQERINQIKAERRELNRYLGVELNRGFIKDGVSYDFPSVCAQGQTFSIMTRVQMIESPYMNEFLDWYHNIGFTKFYMVNTETSTAIKRTVDKKFKPMVKWLKVNSKRADKRIFEWLNGYIREHVVEDFVFWVDSDELLWLPTKWKNIQAYCCDRVKNAATKRRWAIRAPMLMEPQGFQFPWLEVNNEASMIELSMIGSLAHGNPSILVSANKKTMVRAKAVPPGKMTNRAVNQHDVPCYGNPLPHEPRSLNASRILDRPQLLHFSIRNQLHMYLKVAFQKSLAAGRTDQDANSGLRAFITSPALPPIPLSRYPFRMAFMMMTGELSKQHSVYSKALVDGLELRIPSHKASLGSLWKQALLLLETLDIPKDCLGEQTPKSQKEAADKINECYNLSSKTVADRVVPRQIKLKPSFPSIPNNMIREFQMTFNTTLHPEIRHLPNIE